MENIRDWCISRQLWWGHRIPAWYCADCGEIIVSRETPTVCPKCGCTELQQDEDVLDTWFSSALWPFSTLGWPDKTPDLEQFYPDEHVLVTGYDIIFFWVARMIFSGDGADGSSRRSTPFSYTALCATRRAARCPNPSATASIRWKSSTNTARTRFAILLRPAIAPGNDMRFYMRSASRRAAISPTRSGTPQAS